MAQLKTGTNLQEKSHLNYKQQTYSGVGHYNTHTIASASPGQWNQPLPKITDYIDLQTAEIQYVDRVVEVPVDRIVEKIVEVPKWLTHETTVEVEKIVYVDRVEEVEKLVEVIKHVEKEVQVPHYIEREVPKIVVSREVPWYISMALTIETLVLIYMKIKGH